MCIILLASAVVLTFTACGGESPMTDSRDGKTYKTVNIGDKIWMAENLNHQTDGSMCYENRSARCEKNGRLYLWNEAVTACPEGWHLPSRNEFEDLIRQAVQKAGDIKKVGTVLKSN